MASLAHPMLLKQKNSQLPSIRATRIPTTIFLLQMCQNFREVRQLHAQLVVLGLINRPPNAGRLIESYVSTSEIYYASSVFDTISYPDVFAYNMMIRGLTLGSTDSAERVLQQFSEENVLVRNSMISGYLSQGHVQNARAMFDGMRIKDTATWSAMITGYTKNGMYGEALATFQEMMASEVKLNESTLVSALTACAQLGALDQGRWIHTCIDKIKAKISVTLGTSLVDMYAKCGCMDCSYKVFRNMPRKDVVTWGAIISGFALHGQAEKCFELFDEMVANGTCPNEVIFVAILSACSHAGYVELGDYYFEKMVHDFGIRPTVEHYGCMVDLLARAGRLGEAEQLITTMPEEPNSIIWGSLLGGCRNHRDVKRGERAFRQLIELEPLSGDRYKLAGHMFSNVGEKEDADEITKFIKEKKLETTRGSSFIEVDGIIHEFMVGDIDHSRAYEIYGMLEGTY
ncbi:pentatricopeptide repeat-containing protein At5g66520-like isoform X2 [Cornus florida]|uniref:pentatricopeptide repeat-containing protein At5g66520-like isoform X2 n=1 Tax=Cornus florida TaxID=4283 RepID=UPI00289FBEF1|nr:pentatricopeptide repeat-containing protein At5g66520-like isoform X2 [Cornus florida]